MKIYKMLVYTKPVNKVNLPMPKGLSPEKAYFFENRDSLRILEIGCNNREIGYYFRSRGHQYLSFDLNSNNAEFHGDLNYLPFSDASFDAVLINGTLQYSNNPVKSLKECYRVLDSDGFIVGSVAFLEPGIWKSRCHFSARGLYELLREHGYLPTFIWPSWCIVDSLIKAINDDSSVEGRSQIVNCLENIRTLDSYATFSRSINYAADFNFHAEKAHNI